MYAPLSIWGAAAMTAIGLCMVSAFLNFVGKVMSAIPYGVAMSCLTMIGSILIFHFGRFTYPNILFDSYLLYPWQKHPYIYGTAFVTGLSGGILISENVI